MIKQSEVDLKIASWFDLHIASANAAHLQSQFWTMNEEWNEFAFLSFETRKKQREGRERKRWRRRKKRKRRFLMCWGLWLWWLVGWWQAVVMVGFFHICVSFISIFAYFLYCHSCRKRKKRRRKKKKKSKSENEFLLLFHTIIIIAQSLVKVCLIMNIALPRCFLRLFYVCDDDDDYDER